VQYDAIIAFLAGEVDVLEIYGAISILVGHFRPSERGVKGNGRAAEDY
jgi:hypothetical protein